MVKEEKRLKRGERAAAAAIFIFLLLAATKAVVGFLSGSVILLSDAFHSGADILSTLASLLALKIAQRKADQKFPYGYFKAENLAALFVSIFILWAGGNFFLEGIERVGKTTVLKFAPLTLLVAAASILINLFIFRYLEKVGREINSQALLFNAAEKKMDILTSGAVFSGIFLTILKTPFVEGITTVIISLLLLKTGLTSAKDALFALMDVSPGEAVEQKIVEAIRTVPWVEEFWDLRLRKSGPFVFGRCKVGVRKWIDVKRAHEIADKIEEAVLRSVPQVSSFFIHIEPFKTSWRHLAIPVGEKKGLHSSLSDRFARAPYFLFVNIKSSKIKGYYFLKNPYQEKPVRAGLLASKLIVGQKSDTLLTKAIGEISFHFLRDNLVDVYLAKGKSAKEAIDYFTAGKLTQIRKPTRKRS